MNKITKCTEGWALLEVGRDCQIQDTYVGCVYVKLTPIFQLSSHHILQKVIMPMIQICIYLLVIYGFQGPFRQRFKIRVKRRMWRWNSLRKNGLLSRVEVKALMDRILEEASWLFHGSLALASSVARTWQHWNEHDTRTRNEFLKIHMTRVSNTFLTRHGSMIGVSVLHSWQDMKERFMPW